MAPSDADLWTRSRAGDREAFGALFERHAKAIYNYSFRRIGSWATAEDLLREQDAPWERHGRVACTRQGCQRVAKRASLGSAVTCRSVLSPG